MSGHPFDQDAPREQARTVVQDAAAVQAWWQAEQAAAAVSQARADLYRAARVCGIVLTGVTAAVIVFREATRG